jgi:peptide/nickel transport system permease protein
MISYVLRRLLQSVIVLLIVSIVMFLLLHALPGGLVRSQLGPGATAYAVHQLTVQEGLTKPLITQYLVWLSHIVRGNLGFSYKLNESVGSLIATYLPRTLLLVGSSVLLALIIAVPMGLYQATRRDRPDDRFLTSTMVLFYSMPVFLLGVILIAVLSLQWNILPSSALQYGSNLGTDVKELLLPIVTLCLGNVSWFSRYMRRSAIENLLQDYVRTARAKGCTKRRILYRHVLRNAVSPVITMVGLSFPYVISGSLIVEALFSYPGIGLLFYDASQSRDFPVLLGVVLVVTVATIAGNLLADLAYAWVDPRIRYE